MPSPPKKFKTVDKRREKSRHAARFRREKEGAIYSALYEMVPIVDEPTVTHVDRIAALRLAASYCRTKLLSKKGLAPSGVLSALDVESEISKSTDGFLFVVDNFGVIVYISQSVSASCGLTQTDLIGHSLFEYIHADDYKTLSDLIQCDAENNSVVFACGSAATEAETMRAPSSASSRPAVLVAAGYGPGSSATAMKEEEKRKVFATEALIRLKSVLTARGRNLNLRSAIYKIVSFTVSLLEFTPRSGLDDQPPELHPFSDCNDDGGSILEPFGDEDDEETGSVASGRGTPFEHLPQPVAYFLMYGVPLTHPTSNEKYTESSGYMTRHSIDMKFSYCHERISDLLGYDIKVLVGTSLFSIIHTDDLKRVSSALSKLKTLGQTTLGMFRLLACGGGCVWVSSEASLISHNTRGHRGQYIVCLHQIISSETIPDHLDLILSTQQTAPRVFKPLEYSARRQSSALYDSLENSGTIQRLLESAVLQGVMPTLIAPKVASRSQKQSVASSYRSLFSETQSNFGMQLLPSVENLNDEELTALAESLYSAGDVPLSSSDDDELMLLAPYVGDQMDLLPLSVVVQPPKRAAAICDPLTIDTSPSASTSMSIAEVCAAAASLQTTHSHVVSGDLAVRGNVGVPSTSMKTDCSTNIWVRLHDQSVVVQADIPIMLCILDPIVCENPIGTSILRRNCPTPEFRSPFSPAALSPATPTDKHRTTVGVKSERFSPQLVSPDAARDELIRAAQLQHQPQIGGHTSRVSSRQSLAPAPKAPRSHSHNSNASLPMATWETRTRLPAQLSPVELSSVIAQNSFLRRCASMQELPGEQQANLAESNDQMKHITGSERDGTNCLTSDSIARLSPAVALTSDSSPRELCSMTSLDIQTSPAGLGARLRLPIVSPTRDEVGSGQQTQRTVIQQMTTRQDDCAESLSALRDSQIKASMAEDIASSSFRQQSHNFPNFSNNLVAQSFMNSLATSAYQGLWKGIDFSESDESSGRNDPGSKSQRQLPGRALGGDIGPSFGRNVGTVLPNTMQRSSDMPGFGFGSLFRGPF